MAYAQHLPRLPRRSPVLGLIILLHAVLIYFVNAGLRIDLPRIAEDLVLIDLVRPKPIEPAPAPTPASEPKKDEPVLRQAPPEPPPTIVDPVDEPPVISSPPAVDDPAPARIARTSPATDPRSPIMRPPYPPQAIRLEQEGLVVVNACVRPDGTLTDLGIGQSSGYPILDEAALRHLGKRGTRLLPGTEDGHPVTMCTQVPIRFSIQDR